MFKKKDATRLGEILVSKGLITPEQLAIATHEQTKRNRLLNVTDAKASKGVMIGEILVELGFIDQLELKRGLNWQQRLRHVSIAMALCAPFMAFAPVSSSAQTTSSSSSIAANKGFSPITIQAENFSSMKGVVNEPTSDIGGGQNVGNINSGEWIDFSSTDVNIPVSGTYRISYRVASANGGGSFTLNESGTTTIHGVVSVPKTGSWQTWTTVEHTVTLNAGVHHFLINAVVGGFNINWFKIESAFVATPMPLTIQAESYSAMNGVMKETTLDVGGGQNVGNINTGEWLSYNLNVAIPVAGSYKVSYRIASPNAGTSFTLGEEGTNLVYDTVPVSKTGGWQTWSTIERTINLPAGLHNFVIKAVVGGFNLNWFKLEPVSLANSTTSSATSSSAKSSSVGYSTSSIQSSVTPSSAPTSTSSKSSVSNQTNKVAGPVALNWSPPIKRENGRTLDITELGGYELRYKKLDAGNFTYVTIDSAWTTNYIFPWLEGEYIFQIAAFDKNGNYSNFADVHPF